MMKFELLETQMDRDSERVAASPKGLPPGIRRRTPCGYTDACVAWLKRRGFAVLQVEINARIIVRYDSLLCRMLGAAADCYERGPLFGERRCQCVRIMGCEVRWLLPKGREGAP